MIRVSIFRGREVRPVGFDAAVVIDVLRAFTTAHLAFAKGASRILLVRTAEEAVALRQSRGTALLMGEINGRAIPGFDLNNSPWQVSTSEVRGRDIIFRTTNGVMATLAVSEVGLDTILVAGFCNAVQTARLLKLRARGKEQYRVALVASSPEGDDDLAVAEYLRALLTDSEAPREDEVVHRITTSRAARKFLAPAQEGFDSRDLDLSIRPAEGAFVVVLNTSNGLPVLQRMEIP